MRNAAAACRSAELRTGKALITLAPERRGSAEAIRVFAAAGKAVAVAHSAADYDTIRRATDAGLSVSTHLGNGLPQRLPKLDNTLLAQLGEPRLTACFIADGHHVPPAALKAMVRLKSIERSVLVTDAVLAAAAAPGRYSFAGMAVERSEDGVVRQPGQANLAGSALCLDQAVSNVVAWGIARPKEAIAMASTNARRVISRAAAAHGRALPPGRLRWSDGMEPQVLELGDTATAAPARCGP